MKTAMRSEIAHLITTENKSNLELQTEVIGAMNSAVKSFMEPMGDEPSPTANLADGLGVGDMYEVVVLVRLIKGRDIRRAIHNIP